MRGAAFRADARKVNDKLLVLVADDDPDIRQLVRLRLERSGYTVISAQDGAEALELARERLPDIAILDVSMPHLSGLEVARELRARYAGLPVILLTARAGEADVHEGAATGADCYMTKPFSPQGLELQVRVLAHV
jgi:DNA-binding response OmpR family regulator